MRSSVYVYLISCLAVAGGCKHSSCHQCSPGYSQYTQPAGLAPYEGESTTENPGAAALEGPSSSDSSREGRSSRSSWKGTSSDSSREATSSDSSMGRMTFGHAEDYSWLIGRLQKINHADGTWKIRYSPIDEVDQWGGSMVIAKDVRLSKFEEGDIVHVDGTLLGPRPSLYVNGPLYRVRNIRLYDSRLTELPTSVVE